MPPKPSFNPGKITQAEEIGILGVLRDYTANELIEGASIDSMDGVVEVFLNNNHHIDKNVIENRLQQIKYDIRVIIYREHWL